MNESRNLGLLRLHHLQEVTEAKGEEMAVEAARFDSLRACRSASLTVYGRAIVGRVLWRSGSNTG